MDASLSRWRLRRHQLKGFRRDRFSQMWRPVEAAAGLWACPRFDADLPEYLRTLSNALDRADPVQARIAEGWVGLSEGTSPDFRDILILAGQVIEQNGVSRAPPVSGLGFNLTFNAGFYPGKLFGWGSFIILNIGLLHSLDPVNEWILGSSDIHFGEDELRHGEEGAYLNSIDRALPYLLGQIPFFAGDPSLQSQVPAHRPYARMGHMIAKTQKLWVILHELAHWHLGHRSMNGMGSRRQEHEADRQAIIWLLESEASHQLLRGMVPSAVAIPTLFDLLRCAERFYPVEGDTHPSFEVRWHHIADLDRIGDHWGPAAFDPNIFHYLSDALEDL